MLTRRCGVTGGGRHDSVAQPLCWSSVSRVVNSGTPFNHDRKFRRRTHIIRHVRIFFSYLLYQDAIPNDPHPPESRSCSPPFLRRKSSRYPFSRFRSTLCQYDSLRATIPPVPAPSLQAYITHGLCFLRTLASSLPFLQSAISSGLHSHSFPRSSSLITAVLLIQQPQPSPTHPCRSLTFFVSVFILFSK